MNQPDPATDRRDRYATALHRCGIQLDDAGSLADLDDIQQVHVLAAAVVAVADAEQAELRKRYRDGLRRADEINNRLMEEVQRYAAGTERPVLWSVYNEMHKRAATAEHRAAAMEHAMQSTATAALQHSGCHSQLMAQCQRAEKAEAEVAALEARDTPTWRERTEKAEGTLPRAVAAILTDAGLREAEGEHTLAEYGRELARLIQPAAPVVPPAPTSRTVLPGLTASTARCERYAVAIHDAMETDLSLADQEPAYQALIARAAEAAVILADAEQSAPRCICGHTEMQHFEDVCLTEVTGCDCGDYLPGDAAREVIARWQAAATLGRAAVPAAAEEQPTADRLLPDGTLDYDAPPPPAADPGVPLRTGASLDHVAEEQPESETPDALPREPHPTEADQRHALTLLARVQGRDVAGPTKEA